ncbi:MAG: hypothetical protein K0V04_00325, partial [Deltaproteobacteria bacterium]|nr:hypothetical protein [Deltaproteobacteria bacterium]
MSTDQTEGSPPDDPLRESKPDGDDAQATPPEGAEEALGLAQTLLAAPIASDDRPGRRWAYSTWFQLVVSVFVLYHAAILLVHNLPSKGLVKGAQKIFNQEPKLWPPKEFKFGLHANRYWRATGNTQSWAMFAPNPHRSNIFMKVMVKDDAGEVWDLKHDIYGKRTYPYLWYDRMGKINRRIVDQKGYRRH